MRCFSGLPVTARLQASLNITIVYTGQKGHWQIEASQSTHYKGRGEKEGFFKSALQWDAHVSSWRYVTSRDAALLLNMKIDLGIDAFCMWFLMCSPFTWPKGNQAVNSIRSHSAGFFSRGATQCCSSTSSTRLLSTPVTPTNPLGNIKNATEWARFSMG